MATDDEVKIFEEQETIINEQQKKISRLQTKLNRNKRLIRQLRKEKRILRGKLRAKLVSDSGLKNIRQESTCLSKEEREQYSTHSNKQVNYIYPDTGNMASNGRTIGIDNGSKNEEL
jgi:predicted RNase H-like nuclease (RuvC/YqgF family)